MLSILRDGPKLIVFGSTEKENLSAFLRNNLNGMITDINSALEIVEEDNTIVLITNPGKKVASLGDVKSVVLVPTSSDYLFSSLINLNGTCLIRDSHISPGTLIMRTIGDFDKIIESIGTAYNGKIMSLIECIDTGRSNQTILSFTEKPLNNKLGLDDLKPQHVLIDMETNQLRKKIRSQVLRFLNEGLVGVDWNDLQIRIYDKYGKYKLHYDRLSLILDNLETELMLGESWAKDSPRFMMSVLVYQVRLFTLLSPVKIKKILLGLEHLDDGTRIVDLDLIHKNKKIEWPQVIDKSTSGYNRTELSKMFRKQLLDKLTSEDRQKIYMLEQEILNTRY